MKNFLLSLVLIVVALTSFGQATDDYRTTGAGSGNWNALTTWQRYNAGVWQNLTGVAPLTIPTSGDGAITILAGHTVTVTAAANADQLSVAATGQITINAGQTLTLNNGAGTDLTVDGTILRTGTIAGTGTIAFNAGSTYTHNQNGGTVPTATWNATSTCNITGMTTTYPAGMGQAFGNVTFNVDSDTDEEMTTSLSCAGNLSLANAGTGSLRLTNGGTNRTITVAGNFTHTTGEFRHSNGTGTGNITVTGNFLKSGAGEYVIVSSGANSSLTVGGNVTISAGTVTMSEDDGLGTLNVAGNFSHTAGTITESPAVGDAGSGLIVFNGTAAQSLTGGGTVSNIINYRINNSSATGVTLTTPYTIATTLTFTDGYLYTATGTLLTISATGTTPGASNASFVQGPIRKNGAAAYSFPVGNSGIYAPLSISAPALAGDGFTAEYFRGLPPNHANRISALTQLSTVDYWRLDRPAGTSDVNVTLNWTLTSYDPSLLPYGANSTVALHSTAASKWNSQTRSAFTGGPTAGTVTWNAVSNYDDFFAIGVSTIGATGLPVTFANVNAKETNGSVLVNWSNLTESDVNFYEVERSTDGRNFTAIGKIQPKGNDYGKWDYSFTDANPARTNYYRVKAVEFGNSTKSSVILKVSSERTANAFVVYPNPVQNKVVTLQANNIAAGAYSVTIVNANGQQIFAKTMNFQAGSVSQSIELPASVKPGMYMLRIENAGTRSVTSLFVQ